MGGANGVLKEKEKNGVVGKAITKSKIPPTAMDQNGSRNEDGDGEGDNDMDVGTGLKAKKAKMHTNEGGMISPESLEA